LWRVWLLRSFGSHVGRKCRIKPGLRVKYPWRLSVGDFCWLGEDAWIDNLSLVRIADRVCISQRAYLCTGNHNYRSPGFDLCPASIIIESDVWVAACAIVSPGSRIGSGSVIAIGSVVKGTIPTGSIVRGNPGVVTGPRLVPFSGSHANVAPRRPDSLTS
jgi:putative colanic acid biosynthesis acetyltransferase WcaF